MGLAGDSSTRLAAFSPIDTFHRTFRKCLLHSAIVLYVLVALCFTDATHRIFRRRSLHGARVFYVIVALRFADAIHRNVCRCLSNVVLDLFVPVVAIRITGANNDSGIWSSWRRHTVPTTRPSRSTSENPPRIAAVRVT
jgi:hypothetical protein